MRSFSARIIRSAAVVTAGVVLAASAVGTAQAAEATPAKSDLAGVGTVAPEAKLLGDNWPWG